MKREQYTMQLKHNIYISTDRSTPQLGFKPNLGGAGGGK